MPKPLSELQDIAKRIRREIIEMTGDCQIRPPRRIAFGCRTGRRAVLRLDADRPEKSRQARPRPLHSVEGARRPGAVRRDGGGGLRGDAHRQLNTLRKLGSVYQGHPDVRYIHALEASTGSLGEGLSIGIGMGLADRLDGRPNRTFVMLGDGESQEGQIWEAAMSGAFHKIDNVVAIVDYNGIQLDGFVKDIMEVAPLAEKWRAFGWNAIEIDGHDFAAIRKAFEQADATKGKPTCVVAHTIKGKGVSFMENNPKFHGAAPTADEMKLALQELQ